MNEEKLDRLIVSTAKIESAVEAIREDQHQSNTRIEALETWRVGNGTLGVDRKVDRLEQSEKRRGVWIKTLATSLLALAGSVGLLLLKWLFFGGLG